MKNMIIFLIMICSLFLFFSYISENNMINNSLKNKNDNNDDTKEVMDEKATEKRGIFISYIDYRELKNKTGMEEKNIITDMVNNIYYYGFNSIILQVRPFSDAIYNSDIYLSSRTITENEGDKLEIDILEKFIEEASDKNIEVYAWVNPYRIRSTNSKEDISKKNYYYKWFGTDNIEESKNGIYLNPASDEVLKYITDGLEELCKNYDIKGVIYDDYFYPSKTIDLKSYEKTDKKLSLEKYRINNINKLLKRSYDTVKSVNKDLKFGISPAGNIENNLNNLYLDIEDVLKSDYLDLIIPQLYYGFDNSNKPYIKTLDDWQDLNIKNKDFYVALSLYKSGKIDNYAGKGENEWLSNSDIIKKQILVTRNKNNYKGFYIFRYEYLFKTYENENLNKEVKNIRNLLKN